MRTLVSKRVGDLMKEHNIDAKTIVTKTGLSKEYISLIISAKRLPALDKIARIAIALKSSLAGFLAPLEPELNHKERKALGDFIAALRDKGSARHRMALGTAVELSMPDEDGEPEKKPDPPPRPKPNHRRKKKGDG